MLGIGIGALVKPPGVQEADACETLVIHDMVDKKLRTDTLYASTRPEIAASRASIAS